MSNAENVTNQAKTELEKQKAYASKLEKEGFGFDLVIGDAFVRGMRDIGYKHTGTAMDELVDNAIEAGAKNVVVDFKTDKSGKKPEAIAIIDDGHGMPTNMLRASVMWGGTHRENSRSGIGRYGYGLPSASVSQGERFTVYSKTKDGEWNGVTIDLHDIRDGKYNENGRIKTPEPEKLALPKWVEETLEKRLGKKGINSGTIVIWEKLDRLTWSTVSGLTGNLLAHFGTTYRNFIRTCKIHIGEKTVEPIDPLFATPGYRHYDLDEDRANIMDPLVIQAKIPNSDKRVPITVRSVVFPKSFPAIDKAKDVKGKNANARWSVMKDNMGLIICRMGRQIDLVTRTPSDWPSIMNNNARYFSIEIDFPAELDEEFRVTTSKQQITLSERIWDLLDQAGVKRMIHSYQDAVARDQTKRRSERDAADNEPRASEQAMKDSEQYTHFIPGKNSEERAEAAQQAFEQEALRRQKKENKSPEQAKEELQEEVEKRPYKVEYEEIPEGPFYRAEQIGPQVVIYINRRHAFFSSLYSSQDSNPKIRAALELMLFAMGQAELDAIDNTDIRHFYLSERQVWSKRLHIALEQLTNVANFGESDEMEDDDLSSAA